jgi:phage pi2 protein 07
MFPRLRKGGIYILEDMQCSYQDLEQVNVRDKWSGMDLVPQIPDQQRITIDNLISALSHRVDAGEIQSVHLHKNFILVIK